MNETSDQPRSKLFMIERPADAVPWILSAAAIIFAVIQLHLMGRIWWCEWDSPVQLATLDAWSKHTSQHFIDPYFFTHILHGFLFLWISDLLFNRLLKLEISKSWLLAVAVIGESAWEILENSPAIIQQYRENTASLDYFGDSVANSAGDIIACALGFIVAHRLGFWRSLVIFIVIEIVLMVTIYDSLLINIIMLVYPIEAIKAWQTSMLQAG